jgi:hypothetical protein
MVCLSGFQRNKISPLNENCLTTEQKPQQTNMFSHKLTITPFSSQGRQLHNSSTKHQQTISPAQESPEE